MYMVVFCTKKPEGKHCFFATTLVFLRVLQSCQQPAQSSYTGGNGSAICAKFRVHSAAFSATQRQKGQYT